MNQCPREIADGIINVHRTGEGQRQTIIAVAAVSFQTDSIEDIEFKRLIKASEELSGRRNAALHSIIHLDRDAAKLMAYGSSKPSKLSNADVEQELESTLTVFVKHCAELAEFMMKLLPSTSEPPPLKPPRLKVE
jgi:hypothetical protein